MRHDEFIGQVQQRARLGSRGDAERATRATLETLADRIPAGLAENLAAQLPHEIGEHIRRVEAAPDVPDTERFGRDEFIARVAERAGGGVDYPQAAFWTRAVMDVVRDATSGSVLQKVYQSLPDELRSLMAAGSTGKA